MKQTIAQILFKSFKGCLSQTLLGPFLNTLCRVIFLAKICDYVPKICDMPVLMEIFTPVKGCIKESESQLSYFPVINHKVRAADEIS